MRDKIAFVTGATGFIGGALCERLQVEGARVRGLARDPDKGRRLAATGVEVVEADILDHARMSELVVGTDVVFHLAARLGGGTEAQYRESIVDATRHLAEASARAGVGRFVFTSSIMALGMIGDEVVDESRPLREYGDRYGDSKIGAERTLNQLMDTSRLEIVIARLGMVYGPRSRDWSERMLRWVRTGRAVHIAGGSGTAYPVYIDNLIDGLMLCAAHPAAAGQTFNFVDDPVTWAEYLGAYRAMLSGPVFMPPVPRWLVKPVVWALDPFMPMRNLRHIADLLGGWGTISNSKARQLLGWESRVSLDEGMRRTEAWLREAGHL